MVTTQQRRETVALLQQKGVSLRRGCVIGRISRNALRYVPRRPSDKALIEAIKKVRKKHPCYGYRCVHQELTKGKKGVLNHKRVHRVWRENAMQHPPKKRRKRRGKKGQVPLNAAYANHVWTYDFVEDATYDGRKLRFLTIVDEHNRRSLAVHVRRSFTSTDVVNVLQTAFESHGSPMFLRSDNGSEFIANTVKAWLEDSQVRTHYIDPASPWQNAFGESFNGTLRREHLNRNVFASLREAQVLTESWRQYYNTERLHTSLGYQTPEQYFRKTAGHSEDALGALPPNPRDLPLWADPVGCQITNEEEAGQQTPPHPTVFGPDTALGSLPSVALSSVRAKDSVSYQPLVQSQLSLKQESLSSHVDQKMGA